MLYLWRTKAGHHIKQTINQPIEQTNKQKNKTNKTNKHTIKQDTIVKNTLCLNVNVACHAHVALTSFDGREEHPHNEIKNVLINPTIV